MMRSDCLLLSETILFKDIENTEKYAVHIKTYERGELISPEDICEMGIILNGEMKIYKNDLSGGINIVAYIGKGELIGESNLMPEMSENITYICDKKTEVAYFNREYVFQNPCLAERIAVMMTENLRKLRARTMVLCGKSIRDRLKCYFEIIAEEKGKNSFKLPDTMGAIANYLSVDRSAMSREIKKMKEENLLKIEKRNVEIFWETDV